MKVEALTDISMELPKANIVIELPNGQRTTATGYWVREDKNGRDIVVIKSGRKLS